MCFNTFMLGTSLYVMQHTYCILEEFMFCSLCWYTKLGLYLFRNLLSLRPTNFAYCKSDSLPHLSVWSTTPSPPPPPPPPPPAATTALSSPCFLLFFLLFSYCILFIFFIFLTASTSSLWWPVQCFFSSLFSAFVCRAVCVMRDCIIERKVQWLIIGCTTKLWLLGDTVGMYMWL